MFFHHYLMYISSELTMIDAIDAIRKQFMIFVYLKHTTGDRPKYRIYIALISTRYTGQLIVPGAATAVPEFLVSMNRVSVVMVNTVVCMA